MPPSQNGTIAKTGLLDRVSSRSRCRPRRCALVGTTFAVAALVVSSVLAAGVNRQDLGRAGIDFDILDRIGGRFDLDAVDEIAVLIVE